jgi:GWxTD domain-containing protein
LIEGYRVYFALDSAVAEIDLRSMSPARVEMSDLQLASAITSSSNGQPTVFSKQVYEVIPNPPALYGEGAEDLYYYFEAYHLLKNIAGRKYKVVSQVERLDAASGENMTSQHLKSRRYDSIAEVGKINVARLPTGSYRLVGGIADSAGTMLASREKKFFVYNPSASRESEGNRSGTMAAAGPLRTLNEKELDAEFERMLYLTNARERAMFKSLKGAEAKRTFITSIWQSPRGEGATAGMAFREQYLGRARQAEARFKSPARPGWKSDRGRVFILYGPADRLDRFPSTNTSLPYETWSYDHLSGQGGVVFVFADRTGYNHYEQIHSTLEGELQDQNWQKFITRGSGGDNTIE